MATTKTQTCPVAGCGREIVLNNVAQHAAWHERQRSTKSAVKLAPAQPTKQAWPVPPPVQKPAPAGTAPKPAASQGVLITSGLWKLLAALINPFLSDKNRIVVTDEQSSALDQNLAAIVGPRAVSPWLGLIIGLLTIYGAPIVAEAAPLMRERIAAWWKNRDKKPEPKQTPGPRGPQEGAPA